MSIWACSNKSVVQTSSSPQSLKNGIWRVGEGGVKERTVCLMMMLDVKQ